jgi:hypothetical protein
MKGVSELVSYVLIIIISITAIGIVMAYGIPETERGNEILLLQEGKSSLNKIDSSIKDVSYQGEGSSINLKLTITGGSYKIDEDNEEIMFKMESKSQIVGVGVVTYENNMNITGKQGEIEVLLKYDNIDIVDGIEFDKGLRNLLIKNDGWNSTSEKQIIDITVS